MIPIESAPSLVFVVEWDCAYLDCTSYLECCDGHAQNHIFRISYDVALACQDQGAMRMSTLSSRVMETLNIG